MNMLALTLALFAVQVQDSVVVISRPIPPVEVTVPAPIVNVTVPEDTLTARAIERAEQAIASALAQCECAAAGSGRSWWFEAGVLLLGGAGVYYLRELTKDREHSHELPEHEHPHEHPAPSEGHGHYGKGRGHK